MQPAPTQTTAVDSNTSTPALFYPFSESHRSSPSRIVLTGLRLYPHQVAGHGVHSTDGLRCAQWQGRARVLKPLHHQVKGYIEYAFYHHLYHDGAAWRAFTPHCDGILVLSPPSDDSSAAGGPAAYLVLDELTASFRHPCVLDLKMGTQTFDEVASSAKRDAELRKFPHQHATGCRIAGLRTFQPSASAYDTRSKEWCRALTPDDMPRALRCFLTCNGEVPLSLSKLHCILSQLQRLRELFAVQREFRLYSSSLLLLHDAHNPPAAEPLVRMIDFTHVFGQARSRWLAQFDHVPDVLGPAVGEWRQQAHEEAEHELSDSRLDDGYLIGLNTVIDLLQRIASDSNTPPIA